MGRTNYLFIQLNDNPITSCIRIGAVLFLHFELK